MKSVLCDVTVVYLHDLQRGCAQPVERILLSGVLQM